jgi:hypothetical protein
MKHSYWYFVKVIKEIPQGTVWLVEDSYGDRGYLKFARESDWYYSGPLIANEYISAYLANHLGFTVAPLELTSVRGPDGEKHKGVVSRQAIAHEVITWFEAGQCVKDHPEKYINQRKLLRQLVVFDTWIANLDRGLGRNLILARDSQNSKYDWYLIDHGNTLFGSPRKWRRGNWDSRIWYEVGRYCKVSPSLLHSSFVELEPMINKIEELREVEIEDALDNVPESFLSADVRAFTKRLLLNRQKKLRMIIRRLTESYLRQSWRRKRLK